MSLQDLFIIKGDNTMSIKSLKNKEDGLFGEKLWIHSKGCVVVPINLFDPLNKVHIIIEIIVKNDSVFLQILVNCSRHLSWISSIIVFSNNMPILVDILFRPVLVFGCS